MFDKNAETSSNTILSRNLGNKRCQGNSPVIFWCRYVLLSRFKNRYNVPNFEIGRDLTSFERLVE